MLTAESGHTPLLKELEPDSKERVWENMIFVRDSPRLGKKNRFWKIWLGKFGRAARDFGYLNLVQYPPKLTYSAGSFRVKKFGFERAVSKLFILAPNKLVGPHGVHLGQFWPPPAI